ncbi:MAG: baseplate J/gp47 family protein [Paludibacteraceae bacterium]|nr:baseplate J/gp47 family protein [Paludibacteraceae bacterium]
MMDKNYHKGTSQQDRYPKALDPDYYKIDERSFEDLVARTAEFSKMVKYYDSSNHENGSWKEFFEDIYDFEKRCVKIEKIEKYEADGNLSPNLALFLSFLRLFKREQDHLNTLKEKHLDFYYNEMLGFTPRRGCPGKVPVFFELNKNTQQVLIPKGTSFLAGKDADGKPIHYKSVNDIVVNQATVSEVIYETSGAPRDVQSSQKRSSKKKMSMPTSYGVAFSSPFFKQKDGKRCFTFKGLKGGFCKVEYTSEKGWEQASLSNNMVIVEANKPAIVPYNAAFHGEGYDTENPVIRFSLRTSTAPTVTSAVTVDLEVTNSSDFTLRNSNGVIENCAGTYHFGVVADEKAKLIISNPFIKSSFKKNSSASSVSVNVINNQINYDIKDGALDCTLKQSLGYSKYVSDMSKFFQSYANEIKKGTFSNFPSIPTFSLPMLTEPITIDLKFPVDNVQMFAFSPFGNKEIEKDVQTSLNKFFGGESDDSQKIYIGLENLHESCVVNLFFRLDKLAQEKMAEKYNKPIWSYLSGDNWIDFEENMTTDTTSALKNDGIIGFKFNDKAFLPHTIMASDKTWIRLSLKDVKAYPKIEEVKAQSVEVEFDETSEGLPVMGKGLEKDTITKTANAIPGVKAVSQPFVGCEGVYAEDDNHFYSRVSERLRHKDRAVSAWDYERLVLQKFPTISSVICINHTLGEKYSPGSVTLMLLPDSSVPQRDKFKPIVGVSMKEDVKSFVSKHCSPFATVEVVEPKYKELSITCRLSLHDQYTDETYYAHLIDLQLQCFIAPWSDSNHNIQRKNQYNISDILYFIENIPYVNYVKKIEVKVGDDLIVDKGYIESESPLCIFTSAPSHKIIIEQ